MLYSFDSTALKTAPEVVVPTDEDLMARLQSGDESALGLLHQRHSALLRSVILRVVNNEDEADDVLQEIFVEVWKNAARYSAEKGKALGWFVTMSRRRAVDRLRRNQAYGRAGERLRLETERQPANMHYADKEIEDSDMRATLGTILKTLPEAQREAVELAYYKGLSQREIAASTGIPLGTIKTRIELGVRKIAAALRETFGRESISMAFSHH